MYKLENTTARTIYDLFVDPSSKIAEFEVCKISLYRTKTYGGFGFPAAPVGISR
jgi:hypothetical protein